MSATRAYSRDKSARGRKLWRTMLAKHYGYSVNQLRRNPLLMLHLYNQFAWEANKQQTKEGKAQ